jgi:hypothetical protein
MVESTRDYIAKASSCILNKHLQKPFFLSAMELIEIISIIMCDVGMYVDYAQPPVADKPCNFPSA